MNQQRISLSDPFIMVIFGATGDLARYKLIPALFHLFRKKQLPQDFFIYGFARRDLSTDYFHDLYKHVQKHPEWPDFAAHFYYQQGTFEEEKGYHALIKKLETIDKQWNTRAARFFYLATPPQYYETILEQLYATKLAEGRGQRSDDWTKVIIEKPFGKDLSSARKLDQLLAKILDEKQIFRVDHYLGKETVQNIIAFRFANGIFDPVWNATYLDHVQITISEERGIAGRGKFFDGVGNLRDVAQNHLLQLVTAVAMEQPKSFTKESVRDARAKAMKAIRSIPRDVVATDVVRGQYSSYHAETDVLPDSQTETFVAMKFFIDTPRFSDIPFYVRAGKKMAENFVEISLIFKQTCHILFKEYGCPEIGNVLTFRIQPDEGIHLRTIAKKPGARLALHPVDMQFTYKTSFGERGADAYEKLLLDIFAGDQMLFTRSDELEYSWRWISQILEAWEKQNTPVHSYPDNSWGPKAARELIERDGRKWLKD